MPTLLGKYHMWKRKDLYQDYYACTASGNPAVGDPVDINAYCEHDENDERTYYSFGLNNGDTVADVNTETIYDFSYKPYITVVVNPYNGRISTVRGPGVVPKKFVWENGSLADYYVSKYVWPDGVKFKVLFSCDHHDPELEGPFEDNHSMVWIYDSDTNTASVAPYDEYGYYVYCQEAGSWSSYSSALRDYYFFRVNYSGPQ